MDDRESNTELNSNHVTRHTVIETGTTALTLATLPGTTFAGIGELGICGAGAAIANAVYNACGIRIRDYPITLDKLLSKLPVRA